MFNRQREWLPRSHKYSPLPTAARSRNVQAPVSTTWTEQGRRHAIMKLAMVGVLVVVALFPWPAMRQQSPPTGSCDTALHGFTCLPEISHSWGQYSPFYSVNSDISRSTPKGCEVTFAQVLSRHGARDPTASKTAIYSALVQRIHDRVTDYGKGYGFINNYNYTLGADELSPFGQQELVNSGIKFYKRYQHLTRQAVPFLRTSGQNRVVESARNWTQGFHQSRLEDKLSNETDAFPYDMLILPEDEGFNNTLSHANCKAFEDGPLSSAGDEAQTAWLQIFAPPIAEKLNQNLPGANLSLTDTIFMMDLCPFNTVADTNGRISPFCGLFTRDEWNGYDYYQTLGKWYGYGNGNPLGATQGVGFVNELIARLTGKAVVDQTTTNATLDGSRDTFPLNRSLYADFSHDNDMVGVFAALGLYNATEPLSNTTKASPRETKGFSSSWTVPFAARMYVEKMTCDDAADEELVRILVNDRVIPLQNCDADTLGRCKLSRFVDSLSFARAGGNWGQCSA
ncbi:phosphoglycerate mutase-like protein [Apiospora rasikravindrae]|uniref:Phytase A n=1 Tax=Apiospora rasikravindrae TaxID=990691 RepID=A0ABR1TXU5_9PEZI